MPADPELEELDAHAWKTMAYALQRAVLEQFRMIDEMREEIKQLHQIARHAAIRADQCQQAINDLKLKGASVHVPPNGTWQIEANADDRYLQHIYDDAFRKAVTSRPVIKAEPGDPLFKKLTTKPKTTRSAKTVAVAANDDPFETYDAS